MPSEGDSLTVAVLGAGGRMGCAILRVLAETPGARVTAAVDRETDPRIGLDAGTIASLAGPLTGTVLGVPLSAALPAAGVASVWIDFTSPSATAAVAAAAAARGACLVVGTTGVTPEGKQALASAAERVPVVFAPNTSVGITVLLRLVADAARLLGPGYDIEVVETHHRMKRDAPSGTALRLAQALAEATGRDLERDARYARQGDIGPRTKAEIGIQTLRGGDVVGDHTVFFLGDGDRIEITHRASTRDTFARGAVRAALWTRGRPPGLYDMRDVLAPPEPGR
ncbi:MAG: 4-hydroxy-tetrahydrodipicolinate reductase [Pseudomonadota bacterium]